MTRETCRIRRRGHVAMAFTLLSLAVATGVDVRVVTAQEPVPALVVTAVAQDAATDTITITGAHFGARPFVTLDLAPLDLRLVLETSIMVAVPIDAMPPGTYLLTVSRGPLPADRASLDIALGRGAPAATSPVVPMATGLPGASDVGAMVGDRAITVADIDREWQTSDPGAYLALMRELYRQRRAVADRMVNDGLVGREATARGVTPEALLAEEVPKRVIATPDGAVTALFESLGDRARGSALEQMRPSLRAWLERKTEPDLAKMAYVEELMKTSTRADIRLTAPVVTVVASALDPVLGPASAPIELVVYGDLQSPDYVRLAKAFATVRETFGARVRIVFKLLPAFGPQSVSAAEAGACAHAQGKFWSFHDAAAQPTVLDARRLSAIPGEAGLDRRAFEACVKSATFIDRARDGLAEAGRYGITTVPSVLANGRLAPPLPPFLPPSEYLTRLIEEELQRQAQAARKGGP